MLALADRSAADETAEPQASQAMLARNHRDRLLFDRVKRGDRRAREELIERFLPLARTVARRYDRQREPLDDLYQVASVALVKAVDRFDCDRGVAFSSYAVPTISGELKRHFRERSWTVRPPRAVQELSMRLDVLEPRLSGEPDRSPTVSELAAAARVADELALEALQARSARSGLSLQTPVGGEAERELQDTIAVSDGGYEQAEDRAMLDELLAYLSPRSAMVVRLRFERDLTQAEIGALLGVSQMQVSRIVRRAIAHLREITQQQHRMFEAGGLRPRATGPGAASPGTSAPASTTR